MESKRPRSREKHVTGPAKTVQKRGQGLGTGPVGDTGGREQAGSSGAARSAGTRSGGGMKLILLLLVLLLGGGGGLTALLGGQPDSQAPSASQPPSSGQQQSPGSLTSLLSGLGGGSVFSGWQSAANTRRLDSSVAPGAREKYTKLLGGGEDTATIMVYMCGTDLESRSGMGTADLQEMLDARFGGDITLLIYTGGCKAWKNSVVSSSANQIWQVKDGKLICLKENLGSVPMTDPDTLSGYIRWCAENYPASRYELILWDHGGGSVSGYGYDEKFASSGSMNLAGLDTALKSAGVKFDFIGFDACLMATAETALTMAQYADYLIASEETEPGVGWYYTDWLTAFGENTSLPTIQIGQHIADSFVDTCARKCPGQLTTLSVVDLAELETTLPGVLADFSKSTAKLIQNQQYQSVSNARSGAREFAQSSRIDQVDLVHLARNMGTKEGQALADILLGAVKYNRTSSNMTNAYGLSIYFPYRKVSMVDQAASAYRQIGMDEDYARCIRQFASVAASGQAASGGAASPLTSLLGGTQGGGSEMVSELLSAFLGGSFDSVAGLTSGNTGFLSDRAMSDEDLAQYLTDHHFPNESLVWEAGADGRPVLRLSEEQWGLVQSLDLNLFYDDGEGYIDLGLDNVFSFDENGGLLGESDGSWLAVNGQPAAYYHTATVDDGTSYTITGRVPVLHNGSRAELILVFDSDRPLGFVAGIQSVYHDGETETAAKNQTALQPGDTLEFLCDYYSYAGSYQDSYLPGEPVAVTEDGLTISSVPLDGSARATYRFTDLYSQYHWTPVVPPAVPAG